MNQQTKTTGEVKMSEIKHTAEPWEITESYGDRGEKYKDIINNNGEYVRDENFIGDDDLRRIVLCANACAGLPDDSLRGRWITSSILDRAKHLEQQRDQLLDALDAISNEADSIYIRDIAANAIAAVEKSK